MAYNFAGMPTITPMGMAAMGPLAPLAPHQGFMELASQGFPPLPPPPLTLPGLNDSPLEFSTNKNQPPTVRESTEESIDRRNDKTDIRRDRDVRDNREFRDNRDSARRSRTERNDRRDRERRDDRSDRERKADDRRVEERASSANSNDVTSITPSVTSTANASQVDQASGVWGMGVDYSIMGMSPMGAMGPMLGEMGLPHMGHGYGSMGMGMLPHDAEILGPQIIAPDIAAQIIGTSVPPPPASTQLPKEIVYLKSCTLIPPYINAPSPTTRERPPGCKTVFVAGLPVNITEIMIQEIFELCGEITTVHLSKKNFCHIRFAAETSVDSAIYLSGYRVRIGSGIGVANTGRLYVHYAHIYAREDQYEWECKQRQLHRIQRHREQFEEEKQRMQSSPRPVLHYTECEASNICEKIKQDNTFMKAVQIVVTWLERGDCTKRNANTFYSMIQSTNSHVRRLLTERASYEEELQRAKELMKCRMQGLLIQFSQIERVFTAASHKKVWDHFTKAQRKNIEMWKKQSLEIKTAQLEEALMEGEGEMEVSDSEDEPQRKKPRPQLEADDSGKVGDFKEEADSLRCQLEAYKNEVDLLKSETKVEIDAKDKQLELLQQTFKGMQEQLMQFRKQQAQDEQKIKELTARLNARKNGPTESEVITLDKDDDIHEEPRAPKPIAAVPGCVQVTQNDAKLIGLIATFLHIHPFGASVDYVWSFLQKMEPDIRPNDVEILMQRFPHVFKQELSGIGANMERRWQFSGFNIRQNH